MQPHNTRDMKQLKCNCALHNIAHHTSKTINNTRSFGHHTTRALDARGGLYSLWPLAARTMIDVEFNYQRYAAQCPSAIRRKKEAATLYGNFLVLATRHAAFGV